MSERAFLVVLIVGAIISAIGVETAAWLFERRERRASKSRKDGGS